MNPELSAASTTTGCADQRVEPSRRDAIGDWLDVFMAAAKLPKRDARAVRDELEDHLRSRVDDLMIAGRTEPEAVRQSVAELGETVELARRFRTARGTNTRRSIMHATLFALSGAAAVGAIGLFARPAPQPAGLPQTLDQAQTQAQTQAQPAGSAAGASGAAEVGGDAGTKASEIVFPSDIEQASIERILQDVAANAELKLYAPWSLIRHSTSLQPTTEIAGLPLGGLSLDDGMSLLSVELGLSGRAMLVAHRRDGLLVVAPQRDLDRQTASVREYPLPWLTQSPGYDASDAYALITSMVEPDAWRSNGGDTASVQIVGSTIFVNAPTRLHEQVEKMIGTLYREYENQQAAIRHAEQLADRERMETLAELEYELERLRAQYFELVRQQTAADMDSYTENISQGERSDFHVQVRVAAREIEMLERAMTVVEDRIIQLKYGAHGSD